MTVLESCFKSPTILHVRRVVKFLEETVHKSYSENHIIDTIFKTENLSLGKQWATCHLLAAINFLKTKDAIDHKISEDTVRTVLSDLTDYIKILIPDYNSNIPVAYNDILPGQYYRDSNHMFERGELDESSRTHVYRDLLVVLMMRTSFERKIKKIKLYHYLNLFSY